MALVFFISKTRWSDLSKTWETKEKKKERNILQTTFLPLLLLLCGSGLFQLHISQVSGKRPVGRRRRFASWNRTWKKRKQKSFHNIISTEERNRERTLFLWHAVSRVKGFRFSAFSPDEILLQSISCKWDLWWLLLAAAIVHHIRSFGRRSTQVGNAMTDTLTSV